jgi:hypothetical protein
MMCWDGKGALEDLFATLGLVVAFGEARSRSVCDVVISPSAFSDMFWGIAVDVLGPPLRDCNIRLLAGGSEVLGFALGFALRDVSWEHMLVLTIVVC